MEQRLFVAEETYKRLDVFLSDQTEDFTRSRLKKLIEEGNVTVNGKLLDIGSNTAEAGQYLKNVGWYEVADPNLIS